MEVPEPADAGWFTRGASPGALGPAVIAGHVTWDGAPAIFHRSAPCDAATRCWSPGATADRRLPGHPGGALRQIPIPQRDGLRRDRRRGLRLITCGGIYDAAKHRYLDNVIVFARLDSVRAAAG